MVSWRAPTVVCNTQARDTKIGVATLHPHGPGSERAERPCEDGLLRSMFQAVLVTQEHGVRACFAMPIDSATLRTRVSDSILAFLQSSLKYMSLL